MTAPRPAKSPLRFLFVRHGESSSNADFTHNLTVPNENAPLTARGFAQAEACGRFLQDYLVNNPLTGATAFYHSSYTRTRQTAQGIYDVLATVPNCSDMRIQELDLLAEQHVGYLHGYTPEQMAELYPQEMQRFDLHWKEGSRQFAPFYGGELWSTVFHRAITFLNLAFREHETNGTGTFIVVSHGGLMRQFIKYLARLPREWADGAQVSGNCDVRLFQRHGADNDRFGDFGSIYQDGEAHPAELQTYESAGDRLARGAYRSDDNTQGGT